jgi:hypothetical protein
MARRAFVNRSLVDPLLCGEQMPRLCRSSIDEIQKLAPLGRQFPHDMFVPCVEKTAPAVWASS